MATTPRAPRQAVLQAVDLPGGGWVADAAPPPRRTDPGGGDDAALEGFPEDAVVASAESQRFTRGNALAWSVVWVLDGEAHAKAAEAKLHEQAFVERFLADLGGTDPVVEGRHAVVPGPPPIHLDLVPVRAGDVVSLVVLADSPEPFADVDAVVERARRRLQ